MGTASRRRRLLPEASMSTTPVLHARTPSKRLLELMPRWRRTLKNARGDCHELATRALTEKILSAVLPKEIACSISWRAVRRHPAAFLVKNAFSQAWCAEFKNVRD